MIAALTLTVCSVVFTSSVPETADLSTPQRAIFEAVAQEEFCACGSPLTLAGCLQLRPKCTFAKRLSTLLARSIQKGDGRDAALGFLSGGVMGPFCGPVSGKLEIPEAPTLGPAKAPITLVEFADFRCGHCKHSAPLVKKALAEQGKNVRFVFAPFPLSDHPMGIMAAEAALAAHAQGKFAPMQEGLFARAEEFDEASIYKIAKTAGLDMKKFEQDMRARTFRNQVYAIRKVGESVGIQSTPSFFVNGRPFELNPERFPFAERFAMEQDRNTNLGQCQ